MDLFTTHAQRLTARLSENLAERSKELGLPLSLDALSNPSAAATGLVSGLGKGMWDDAKLCTSDGERETVRLLNGKTEKEREEGLRRVIVMMCKNRPVLSFFPAVTNCLHSPSFATSSSQHSTSPASAIATRQLVSIYILRHATSAPDLALLSVNTFQKDLSHPNPAIRALALKTLSGMGLDTVAPLVMMSISKAVRDGNWWVRRAACEAMQSIHSLDSTSYRQTIIEGPLRVALNDSSAMVIGSALSTWQLICPTRFDLLHGHYRRYCKILADVDEWGQIVTLQVLTRYARSQFQDPSLTSTLNVDLDLLIRSSSILLQSQNSAVVSSCIYTIYLLAPTSKLSMIISPLIHLVSSSTSQESLCVTLNDIYIMCSRLKDGFKPYLPHFYIYSNDTFAVKMIKLKILVVLAAGSDDVQVQKCVMAELTHYVGDPDDVFVGHCIASMTQVAKWSSNLTHQAMNLYIQLTKNKSSILVSEAVLGIRNLLIHCPQGETQTKVITGLVRLLLTESITSSSAKSTIFWLVGQQCNTSPTLLDSIALDLVRVGVKNFMSECKWTKLQILTLCAKCFISSKQHCTRWNEFYKLTFQHVSNLARFDVDFEVRDKSRFLSGLISTCCQLQDGVSLTTDAFSKGEVLQDVTSLKLQQKRIVSVEQVAKILFEKSHRLDETRSSTSKLHVGSMSSLGHFHLTRGVWSLPPWTQLELDSSVRDDVTGPSSSGLTSLTSMGSDTIRQGGSSGNHQSPIVLVPRDSNSRSVPKPKVQKLRDFLHESESEAEEESSEEEEESEDETSEEASSSD